MDKKLIFELISSLLTFYKNQNSTFKDNFSGLSSNPKSKDMLHLLSSLISKKEESAQNQSENIPVNPQMATKNISEVKHVPLQRGMIATLNNHDEFVKRVYKNNPKKDS